MATATSHAVTPDMATKPNCVQPGGGQCMELELAWGRLRRAYLRRVRPGYVRRMAELRQGECPNCPHDIIDSRDLKYWRNVCGYWFRPEDDPYRGRDRIGLARYGLAELILFSTASALLTAFFAGFIVWGYWPFWIPLAAVLLVWAEIIYFFRDPGRRIPTDADTLLSPADGTVTHVGEVEDADFPGGRAFRISIFLSIFNVHVNRVPRDGRVLDVRYFPGCFLDARHPECGVRNEQLWLDLRDDESNRLVRVKQISGAVARRIVCWLKPGDAVKAGDRFGMIKFGSRTDILVPADDAKDVIVRVGDKVKGGLTILVRLKGTADARG